MHTGEGNAPPAPPPADAVGGVRSGCFTDSSGSPSGLAPAGWPYAKPAAAPFRCGALPLLLGRVSGPLVSAASLRNPPRRSPTGAASRQRLPHREGAPAIAAPRRARTAAAMHSAAAPASAPGVATPSTFRQPRRWHWLPRHPTHARPPPQQRAGRFRSVVSCGPATVQAGHALAQRLAAALAP